TDDVWTRSSTPPRYYAGFAPVADGFYSSGQPDLGDDEPDPLGLVKSEDMGETLEWLAFTGESLFNQMGAGYRSNTVYVINEEENSQLPPGLHYTQDDGATWGTSAAQGIRAVTLQVAVHPDDPAVVALPSYAGLYLSTDFGDTFNVISQGFGQDDPTVSAAIFSPAEDGVLIYGFRTLARAGIDGSNPSEIPAPQVSNEDAILSIAVNPTDPAEMAFATYERAVWRNSGTAARIGTSSASPPCNSSTTTRRDGAPALVATSAGSNSSVKVQISAYLSKFPVELSKTVSPLLIILYRSFQLSAELSTFCTKLAKSYWERAFVDFQMFPTLFTRRDSSILAVCLKCHAATAHETTIDFAVCRWAARLPSGLLPSWRKQTLPYSFLMTMSRRLLIVWNWSAHDVFTCDK
ncbi:MAG: hypothetical protein R3A10_21820, partial [Caldilineaceae bacterium]